MMHDGCVFVNCRANSVTWNPHKMMSVPLQCSALLVREEVGHIPSNSTQNPVQCTCPFLFSRGNPWLVVSAVSILNLTPRQGLMQNCNQMHACYLFQQDKHYDLSYDTGDKALQCGRHVDIFKLWLMWRAKVGKSQRENLLSALVFCEGFCGGKHPLSVR